MCASLALGCRTCAFPDEADEYQVHCCADSADAHIHVAWEAVRKVSGSGCHSASYHERDRCLHAFRGVCEHASLWQGHEKLVKVVTFLQERDHMLTVITLRGCLFCR